MRPQFHSLATAAMGVIFSACFTVPPKRHEDDFIGSFRFGVPMALAQLAKKALGSAPPFVAKIIVHEELSLASEQALRSAIKQACHSFRQQLGHGSASLTQSFPSCTVTIELLTSDSEQLREGAAADRQLVECSRLDEASACSPLHIRVTIA